MAEKATPTNEVRIAGSIDRIGAQDRDSDASIYFEVSSYDCEPVPVRAEKSAASRLKKLINIGGYIDITAKLATDEGKIALVVSDKENIRVYHRNQLTFAWQEYADNFAHRHRGKHMARS